MDALKEKGVIENIMKSIGSNSLPGNSTVAPNKEIPAGKRFLHFRVLGGKAFVGALTEEVAGGYASYLVMHVHFKNQRFASKVSQCRSRPFLLHTSHCTQGLTLLPSTPPHSLCSL